jgi:plasmid stabilization system protein ParE
MILRKAETFLADAELQFEWYARNAGWDVAERYLAAVSATCALIERQPLLGPLASFTHPKLSGWRFFVVIRPFQRHVLFYETGEEEVTMRRVLHGHRNLSQRLLEKPGAE